MKSTKALVILIVIAATAAVIFATRPANHPSASSPQQTEAASAVAPSEVSPPKTSEIEPPAQPTVSVTVERAIAATPLEKLALVTNKLERLTQIREMFRVLALGDQLTAMRAAKQFTNEVERETALLALVTEWTQGDLRPSRLRAHLVDVYGVEAGLGIEVAKDPALAMLWANELTQGPGRAALMQSIARWMVGSDPASALALNEQLPESDRRPFFQALFNDWAANDTETALQWSDRFSDPTDRAAVMEAINQVAPVGIGTVLAEKDGYTLIAQLVPGMPAELSGQLHAGDRLVAIAQGDSAFVDARGLPIQDVAKKIRGAPGTTVQLQVLAADALPGSPPRVVSIYRDQIKFKR